MERKTLTFTEIRLQDIKDIYKCLDEWNDYYGWKVYKNGNSYILEDTQTGDIEYYNWFFELLKRLSSRALDYETDEREYDDETISVDTFNYLNNLLFIYLENNSNMNETWVKEKIQFIKKLCEEV
jgi:hypothetical protein